MQSTRPILIMLAILTGCEPLIRDIGETLGEDGAGSMGESVGDSAESFGGTSGTSTEGSATTSNSDGGPPSTSASSDSSAVSTDDGNPTATSTGTDDGNPTATSTGTDDGNPTATSTGTDDGNPTATSTGTDDGTGTSTTGGPVDDAELCTQTGGVWHEVGCSHDICGEPQTCINPIVPGCSCGPSEIFVEGVGCAFDRLECSGSLRRLCVDTGGTWDEGSCGDYECGNFPACDAVIPGCDCGSARSFDVMEGCFADASCGVAQEGQACDPAADNCAEGLACCYPCGIEGCDHVCQPAGNDDECPPPPPSSET